MAEGVRGIAEGMSEEAKAGLAKMFPKEFEDRFAAVSEKSEGQITFETLSIKVEGKVVKKTIARRALGNLANKGWYLPPILGGKWVVELDNLGQSVLVCERE